MIELRMLGRLSLTGADGREVRGLLGQPRRLALLAYLAAASPQGFHRRDTLLALFWPELDQEHARAARERWRSVMSPTTTSREPCVGLADQSSSRRATRAWCAA